MSCTIVVNGQSRRQVAANLDIPPEEVQYQRIVHSTTPLPKGAVVSIPCDKAARAQLFGYQVVEDLVMTQVRSPCQNLIDSLASSLNLGKRSGEVKVTIGPESLANGNSNYIMRITASPPLLQQIQTQLEENGLYGELSDNSLTYSLPQMEQAYGNGSCTSSISQLSVSG